MNSGLWDESLSYMQSVEGEKEGSIVHEKRNISVKEVIDKKGYCHVIFYDENMLQKCKDSSQIFVDGTFKVVPRLGGAKQLVTFACEKFDQVRNFYFFINIKRKLIFYIHTYIYFIILFQFVPLFYVLMTKKEQTSYEAVIKAIKEIAPSLNPSLIMSDFEVGLMNALQIYFPDALVRGCFFHFHQVSY